MRQIRTSNGTYDVDFAWAPDFKGACVIKMADSRRLPAIAADFDGLESIHYTDGDAEQEYDWKGYSRLVSLAAQADGGVLITLEKEA